MEKRTSNKKPTNPKPKAPEQKEVLISKSTFIQYKQGMIEKDYKIGDVIGNGAFATVRKVYCKSNGQMRALKIIRKHKGQDNARNKLEVSILKQLVHPNIMQVFEFYEDSKNFYIITEFCEGGELFDKVVEKGSFSEQDAAKVMYQLLSACSYIHANHIVHRDLKPENILLDTKNDDYVIKIIDWGTARTFNPNKKMNHISGTPYYIAPEVLKEKYDEKCDVWSCGVILYILLCGYPPFNADTDEEILEKIKKGKFIFPAEEWDLVSKEAKEFICKLLEYDPKKRLSASKALEEPWINKNKNSLSDNSLPIKCLQNMKNFHAKKKLQQATLTYIVHNLLSKQEKNALLEMFQQFDTNGDGVLSREEITNGYKQFMPFSEVEKEVDRIFEEVDIDKNGTIDYNEFVLASMNSKNLVDKARLENTFKMFDKDGNGSISADEIKAVLGQSIDPKLISEMISEVDEDGNGEIDLEEFKNMMANLLK